MKYEPTDRDLLFDTLNAHILRGKETGKIVAVLVIRILRLREINLEYGFSAGDIIQSDIQKKIESIQRPADVIFKISESEFVIILPALQNAALAILAADKISGLSKQQMELGGNEIKISMAIGVATFPEHANGTSSLLRCAGLAATQAQNKFEAYQMYNAEEEESNRPALSMQGELESAISNNEIHMHYQPQVELKTNSMVGIEALARWNSKSRGPVPPDVFVGVAEETGLIMPLTLLTMNIALRECSDLLQGNRACSLGINLSASILQDKVIVKHVVNAMNVWNVKPEQLTLEVTETAVMANPDVARETLEELRSERITISMDDFGTGYSSLGYLQALPISELKIDKSFVINMMTNEGDAKIARAIIDLAHNFDFSVVAEGIENRETLKKLIEMGCNIGQGYFIARPMPISDI